MFAQHRGQSCRAGMGDSDQMQDKMDFLVSYDFGKAGVWGVVKARTVDEIKAKYPELEVIKAVPNNFTFDIDDEPQGWLAEMVGERGKPA